jgi:hypothetical protein
MIKVVMIWVYEAMGYVRKSERSTGKTNKTKPAPATAAAH